MSTQNNRVRGASYELVSAARQLRTGHTEAEAILWCQLRGRKLGGFKFRRQYPVGIHILDFACAGQKLVNELDGKHHDSDDQYRYDQDRTQHLEQFGYRVVCFPNADVLTELAAVLDQIRIALTQDPHLS